MKGPRAVVVSGDLHAALRLRELWRERGRKTRRLRVSHAFHSAHLEPILDSFGEVAVGLSYHRPRLPVISNLTGEPAGAEMADPAYWVRHVRAAVRFADGVRAARALGAGAFLEVGPEAVLTGMIGDCLVPADRRTVVRVPLLRGDRPEDRTVSAALAALHVQGHPITWAGPAAPGGPAHRTALPTYAFARRRYWLDDVPAPVLPSSTDVPPADVAVVEDEALHPQLSTAESFVEHIRAAVAFVLGYVTPDAVDPGSTFKTLGFDSLTAQELMQRLGSSLDLDLASTLSFDHPTPIALAAHLRELAGGQSASATALRTRARSEEPIAIVAMGCRFPGGADSPEQLWRIVADGVDAIGDFPTDRGWDIENLYDPDPDQAGHT